MLVVYYSKTGNTKKVAQDLAKELKADIDEIIDLKDRNGIKGWLLGGRDATKSCLTEIKTNKDPSKYDLVIIGTPIWAWNSTPAVRTYITNFKNRFKKVVIFATSGGTKIEKIVPVFKKILNKKIDIYEGWIATEIKNNKIYQEKINKFIKKIL